MMNRRSIFRALAGAVAGCCGAKAAPASAQYPDIAEVNGAPAMPRFRGIADAIRGRVHSWSAPKSPTVEECVIMVARALSRCSASNTEDPAGYRLGCSVDHPDEICDYTDWVAKLDRGEPLPVLAYRPWWIYEVARAREMLTRSGGEAPTLKHERLVALDKSKMRAQKFVTPSAIKTLPARWLARRSIYVTKENRPATKRRQAGKVTPAMRSVGVKALYDLDDETFGSWSAASLERIAVGVYEAMAACVSGSKGAFGGSSRNRQARAGHHASCATKQTAADPAGD